MCSAVGNVLWSDMWREFLDGFGNIKMCVFHGATERNIFFNESHWENWSSQENKFLLQSKYSIFLQKKYFEIYQPLF